MTEQGGGGLLRVALLLVAKKFFILPFGSFLGPWTALGSASPIFGFCLDWWTQHPEDGSAQPKTEADEPVGTFRGLCHLSETVGADFTPQPLSESALSFISGCDLCDTRI